MDLLALIHNGEISPDEAQRNLQMPPSRAYTMEKLPLTGGINLQDLTNYEATALLHGARSGDLHYLRYNGGPTSCCNCGQPLDYRLYGWWVVPQGNDIPQLRISNAQNMKLHLDTDIGSDMDDLCALAMLLKWPDLEITGITTVSDDRGRRAGYVRYVLGLAGRTDIPVAAGADVSEGYYRFNPATLPTRKTGPNPSRRSPARSMKPLSLLKRSIDRARSLSESALTQTSRSWTANIPAFSNRQNSSSWAGTSSTRHPDTLNGATRTITISSLTRHLPCTFSSTQVPPSYPLPLPPKQPSEDYLSRLS